MTGNEQKHRNFDDLILNEGHRDTLSDVRIVMFNSTPSKVEHPHLAFLRITILDIRLYSFANRPAYN